MNMLADAILFMMLFAAALPCCATLHTPLPRYFAILHAMICHTYTYGADAIMPRHVNVTFVLLKMDIFRELLFSLCLFLRVAAMPRHYATRHAMLYAVALFSLCCCRLFTLPLITPHAATLLAITP